MTKTCDVRKGVAVGWTDAGMRLERGSAQRQADGVSMLLNEFE
jgi:hypothetical protein